MTDRFPDLEIYLMKPAPDAVRDWLAGALGSAATDISLTPGHSHWRFTVQGEAMDVFLNENAEKNFASLWFKQNLSPEQRSGLRPGRSCSTGHRNPLL